MEEDQKEDQKKISLPEAILMVLIVGSADIFDVPTGLSLIVPAIGQILLVYNWFIDTVVLAVISFWFILKGGVSLKKKIIPIIGNLIEFIPLLDILPIRTISVIIGIYLVNKPEAKKIIGAVEEMIGTAKEKITKIKEPEKELK